MCIDTAHYKQSSAAESTRSCRSFLLRRQLMQWSKIFALLAFAITEPSLSSLASFLPIVAKFCLTEFELPAEEANVAPSTVNSNRTDHPWPQVDFDGNLWHAVRSHIFAVIWNLVDLLYMLYCQISNQWTKNCPSWNLECLIVLT